MAELAQAAVKRESFADLLNETLGEDGLIEGSVLRGLVANVTSDFVMIDVGLKSEGLVAVKEFTGAGEQIPAIGDEVDVYVDRYEDRNGQVVLSREKARREEAWVDLERAYAGDQRAEGHIFGRVKGGYMVDLKGAVAFLPNSQVDVRPVRDISPLMNMPQPFQILKMDRKRGNIVVSRRAILEESRAEARSDFVSNLREGQVLQGVVKNITDYGAFIDLGGVDGLLHVTDIAWRRINHPSEVLHVGQQVSVQVVRFDPEKQRISLGMKQLESDPWTLVAGRFGIGEKYKGRVTNITEYGAFVELEPGIEGLVHVSEMAWGKKNLDAAKMVSTSQEVEVVILEIDSDKRRISLGMKQCQPNPFAAFEAKFPIGSTVTATVKTVNSNGLLVSLDAEVEGFVSAEDLSWTKSGKEALEAYEVGATVQAKVLGMDAEKDRAELGIKQLENDPREDAIATLKKGATVTCTVAKVQDNGIEVEVVPGISSFIRRSDLSRDRSEQRPDRFAVGEKLDALVTAYDKATRKITVSVKAREIEEEKQVMAEYGSADSGASLGDILGAAFQQAGVAVRKGDSE
jgi:small subunit ribosomal protein S1